VQSATYAFPLPFTGGNMRVGFSLIGYPAAPSETPIARLSSVAPNFFSAMRVPILAGRTFTTAEDQPKGPPAVIVNDAFVKQFFPGVTSDRDVLSKQITSGFTNPGEPPVNWQIVGVVGNTKRLDLTEATEPEYYLPLASSFFSTPTFALRTSGDPMRLADTVRRTVARIDPALPVFNVFSYETLLERNTALRRFQAILLTGFAVVALLLAAIGLYASLSYMVVERTSELGLRMALGSQREDVLALVLRRGLSLAAVGLTIGLVTAAVLTRFVGSLLYSTRPLDALTFGVTTLLLLAVCGLSSLLPALRAASIDPMRALRTD